MANTAALKIPPAAMAHAAREFRGKGYTFKGCGPFAFDGFGLIRACVAKVTGTPVSDVADVARNTPDWTEAVTYSVSARWLNDMGLERADDLSVGDVLIFQVHPDKPGVHVAVLTETHGAEPKMVHAYWGRSVIESYTDNWLPRRLIGAYRLRAGRPAMRRAA